MNPPPFITCAVTGSGDTTRKSAKVPVTPKEIAAASIEAARAGAAIAHIHVRDPAPASRRARSRFTARSSTGSARPAPTS